MRISPGHRPAAVAVETAMLLPFLALAFLAALDFARVYVAAQTLESAAHVAALSASGRTWEGTTPQAPSGDGRPVGLITGLLAPVGEVPPPDVAALTRAAVTSACKLGATLDPPTCEQDVRVAIDTSARTATVRVESTFSFVAAVPGLGPSVTLSRTKTMPLARQTGE